MGKSFGTLFAAAALAACSLLASAQTLQRPKLPTSVLTKPGSSAKVVVESKNVGSAVALKAPVIDLGLPDGASEARDINENGAALVNNLEKKTCFVWTQAEGFKPVLPEGASFSVDEGLTVSGVVGRGINNKGQVAGNVVLSDGRKIAFLWDPEVGMKLLGALPGGNQSVAIDVSDNGIVAGSSLTARSKVGDSSDSPELFYFKQGSAFAWAEDMGMIPIGRFGTLRSWSAGINSKGVIAGGFGSHVDGIELTQSFLWSREEGAEVIFWHHIYSSSDRVRSGAAIALDVRDDGTVPMYYYQYSTEGDNPYPGRLNTAVLVRNGRLQYAFSTPSTQITYKIFPLGLNDSNICVGYQAYRGGKYGDQTVAFAWRPGAEIADLNTFATGWEFVRAYRINSKNQVVGIANNQGKTKGFIMNLSPTLLPTSASKALDRVEKTGVLAGSRITIPPKQTKPPKS